MGRWSRVQKKEYRTFGEDMKIVGYTWGWIPIIFGLMFPPFGLYLILVALTVKAHNKGKKKQGDSNANTGKADETERVRAFRPT